MTRTMRKRTTVEKWGGSGYQEKEVLLARSALGKEEAGVAGAVVAGEMAANVVAAAVASWVGEATAGAEGDMA